MWIFPSLNEDRVPVKAGQFERFGALCFGWDAEDVSGLGVCSVYCNLGN